ncbi:MAG: FAD-dependent oxidoreductase [Rhodocyclales bacterium]|nr:FAD-dependent oxidoreductase [Rhodocyclales bacterium]
MRQKIAIIGSGISGLGAAYLLSPHHDVTIYEADHRPGGHSHTVDVQLDGQRFGVDTGFLVFNERTYPLLCRLFGHLKVPVVKSDMSFSVKMAQAGLEWAGTNLDSVFAQRRNLFKPAFWGMLRDILRFNKGATRDLENPSLSEISLGDYLDQHGYGQAFRHDYLLPMAAAIWSCPTEQMLAYPFQTFVRFCHNHGLLQIMNRPQWMTVAGGSRNYVSMLLDGIRSHGGQIKLETPVTGIKRSAEGVVVSSSEGHQAYEQMIMACHSDQALKILGEEASPHEKTFLGAIQYQANRAVLHTDTALLPINPKTWAAWNYASPGGHEKQIGQRPVSVSYLLNKLQPLPTDTPVMVTLNPWHEPDPARTFRQIHYAHPVLDGPAIAAQDSLKKLSGFNRTFYAGAWMGYGFHEDGFASAVRAASQLAPLPDWILGPQPQLNQIALNMPMPATVNP